MYTVLHSFTIHVWVGLSHRLSHGLLQVFGRIRLPQDVHAMSRRFGRRWAELLETFFRLGLHFVCLEDGPVLKQRASQGAISNQVNGKTSTHHRILNLLWRDTQFEAGVQVVSVLFERTLRSKSTFFDVIL